MRSVKPYDTDKVRDSTFVIPVNDEHILRFAGDYYTRPFMWASVLNRSKEYVTIANGKKIVTQTLADNGGLFSIDSYTLILEEDRRKVVEFVFTDAFFENGQPIER